MFTIEETFVCTLPGIARIKTFKGWSKLYASNLKKDSPTSFPASFLCGRHAVLEVDAGFALFPPIKWVKTSVAVWHGKGSVSYFRISLNTRSFSGSVDAVVVDADWTIVPSGACWNQLTGLTFTFFLGGMSACFRWVMGESASTIWPIQKIDPFDPLTHDPSTHCLLWL